MASLEEIEAKQKKMVQMGLEMATISDDPDKVIAMGEKMVQMGKELERACQALADSYGTLSGGDEVRVELTKDQRARIAEATGVPMEILTVRDRDGSFNASMPERQKDEIERIAAMHVTNKAVKKARTAAIDKLIKTFEDLIEPSLQETIDLMKEDPTLQTLLKKQLADEKARKEGSSG